MHARKRDKDNPALDDGQDRLAAVKDHIRQVLPAHFCGSYRGLNVLVCESLSSECTLVGHHLPCSEAGNAAAAEKAMP
eukprot:scaffold118022_cov22-Tisochrysis_lutea.AAC.1